MIARFLAFCQDLPGTQEGGAEQAPSWGIHQEYGPYYVELLFTIFWGLFPHATRGVGLGISLKSGVRWGKRAIFSAVEKEMGHGARLVV